jgi:hypothetical protein
MLNAHFKPLHQWSGSRTKDDERKFGAFKVAWLSTLDLLEHELGKLRASHVVIEIEDPEAHKRMRNDGSMTLSDKYWPDKAGVVLTFESPKGNISMPCDRYRNWRDNLRAIALSLEALRAVDRYGVTRGNEQYRGWAQLEAPTTETDREGAIQTIASILNAPRDAVAANPAAFIKQARIAYHPDGVTDPGVKKQRHEMSVLISKAERALFPGATQAGS